MRTAFVALFFLVFASACVSGRPAGEGYLEGITDPGPDDAGGPSDLCNVAAAKPGAEHDQCVAHNRAVYQSFSDEAKKREPWFNFPPDGWAQAEELADDMVLAVAADHEAAQKLESAAAIELAPAEVQRFTGKAAQIAGRKAFLVRALLYYRDTGSFHVYQKDQSILVQHDSLGLDKPAETRSAVVVFLPQAPRNVYVDCSLLE